MLPNLVKCNQGKKLLEIPRIFFKKFTLQIFRYVWLDSVDSGLNISWFPGIMASTKPMRHRTLNNRNCGQEAIVMTTVIFVRTTVFCKNKIVVKNDSKTPKHLHFQLFLPLSSRSFRHSFSCYRFDASGLGPHFTSLGNTLWKFLYYTPFSFFAFMAKLFKWKINYKIQEVLS